MNTHTKYKVRDITTNLYQGTNFDKWTGQIEWSKKGKTWNDVEDLKKHFKSLEDNKIQLSPLWEVIETKNEDSFRYPATVFSSKKKSLI